MDIRNVLADGVGIVTAPDLLRQKRGQKGCLRPVGADGGIAVAVLNIAKSRQD